MAIQTALGDLRQRFYLRFDEGQSQYIGTAEANVLINEAGAHLHNWIISSCEYYIWKTYTYNIVLNTQDYALPPDFFKDLKVFGTYSNGGTATPVPYYWPLKRFMPTEFRGGPLTTSFLPYNQALGYMIMGQTLRVIPVPSYANFNIEMWYTPHYTQLVNDTDVMDVSVCPGWDEWVVNYAVISAKIKEEADISALTARQAELKMAMEADIANRDLGQPTRWVDAYANNFSPNGSMFPGDYGFY